jgi:high-affinity iron transporter
MFDAFIITLREGVEAALIVGIVFAYLTRIGRHDLKRIVFYALGLAVAASVLGAIVLARTQWNSDIFEGWVMLAAACFVVSMIWFMQRAARTLRGDIESKLAAYTSGESGAAGGNVNRLGLFFFVFLLVLREGVETVLILAGVTLNSTELLSFTGTLLGIGVAVVFGVLFIRGSVKINLQRFFRVTTVILYFVAFQLVVSGLHELSENGVLPSSAAEMRLIGPIVRSDYFFFVTMLALVIFMVLLEYARRAPARKAAWSARRERRWMVAIVVVSFVFISFSTAETIYARSSTALSPTTPVTLIGSQVTLPTAAINDDQLHRFGVVVDDGKGGTVEVRFLLYKKPGGSIVSVADACQICGPVGFYLSSQGIICKMCASPLAPNSMGQPGGCNPIPLKSTTAGGELTIAAADLRALAPTFEK